MSSDLAANFCFVRQYFYPFQSRGMTTLYCTVQGHYWCDKVLSKLVVLGMSPWDVELHSRIVTGRMGDHIS